MEGVIDWLMESVGLAPLAWFGFVFIAAMGMASYTLGRIRALSFQYERLSPLRSSPTFHAIFLLVATIVPMIAIFLMLAVLEGPITRQLLITELPERLTILPRVQLNLYIETLQTLARQPEVSLASVFDEAARSRLIVLKAFVRLVGALLACLLGLAGFAVARKFQSADAHIQSYLERLLRSLFFASAAVAVAITLGIVLSLALEGLRFFSAVSPLDFLFGLTWNPQNNEAFGAVPLFFGTLVVALIAMTVSAPIGILSAIYLSEYASRRTRQTFKPAIEVLAGIPTVVYGFFAIIVIAPPIRSVAREVNSWSWTPDGFLAAQPNSVLAAGLVMGIMIIPFVSSLTDDALQAVPQDLKNGSLSLGSTQSEMIRFVVLPAAAPGIAAALLLAVSRAIGETMIVVMAAGQRAQITLDATSDITTVTAQIVTLLIGDSAFDSSKAMSAFALGGVLFLVTLLFNLVALRVVRRNGFSHG
ncbi:MAG: phosphate ABC transporter permease subunit PstC [Pseudomonadota bacterium]